MPDAMLLGGYAAGLVLVAFLLVFGRKGVAGDASSLQVLLALCGGLFAVLAIASGVKFMFYTPFGSVAETSYKIAGAFWLVATTAALGIFGALRRAARSVSPGAAGSSIRWTNKPIVRVSSRRKGTIGPDLTELLAKIEPASVRSDTPVAAPEVSEAEAQRRANPPA